MEFLYTYDLEMFHRFYFWPKTNGDKYLHLSLQKIKSNFKKLKNSLICITNLQLLFISIFKIKFAYVLSSPSSSEFALATAS